MTEAVPPSPWMRSASAPADAQPQPAVSPPEILDSEGERPGASAGGVQGVGAAQPAVIGGSPTALGPTGVMGASGGSGGPGPGGGRGAPRPQGFPTPERHPADPDETPSTKAWAVLALGVVGVTLMGCGGGLVPGLAGLILARPARAELAAAAGFLTGGRSLRAGEILSWIAVAVSTIVIVAVVIGLLIGSVGNGPDYDSSVN